MARAVVADFDAGLASPVTERDTNEIFRLELWQDDDFLAVNLFVDAFAIEGHTVEREVGQERDGDVAPVLGKATPLLTPGRNRQREQEHRDGGESKQLGSEITDHGVSQAAKGLPHVPQFRVSLRIKSVSKRAWNRS